MEANATPYSCVGSEPAARPFLLAVLAMEIVVVSRLRKDACLHDVPAPGAHGNRTYGKNKVSLAKRAGSRRGWSSITYHCRGVKVTRQYRRLWQRPG